MTHAGTLLALAVGAMLCATAAAEPGIEWTSQDVVLSKRPAYKYIMPKPYTRPADPKAPNPGRNFMIGLTVSDTPPRVTDRLLKRNAALTGRIVDAPVGTVGKVWLEDNYSRVLDRTEVSGPEYGFSLNASRSVSTGLYLKAELRRNGRVVWSGQGSIRMVPAGNPWRDFILGVYDMGTRPGTATPATTSTPPRSRTPAAARRTGRTRCVCDCCGTSLTQTDRSPRRAYCCSCILSALGGRDL